jgi:glucose/arabinose dehydrogenase
MTGPLPRLSLPLCVCAALVLCGCGAAAIRRGSDESAGPSRSTGVELVRLGRFNQPVQIVQPIGERRRLFVVEKIGRIRVIRGGKVLKRAFLSIRSRVSRGHEQGLLSLAFPPDYWRRHRFYVNFTDRAGNTHVTEFRRSRRNPDRANRGSGRRVLFIHQPGPTHNGGQLLFGPEGHLYVGLGDGGGVGDPRRRGQMLRTFLGKILRIDPRPRGRRPYGVPDDNPFVGKPRAWNPIYAYGLRNPWRFSFDRLTGALAIGDVGQNTYEEIDYFPPGKAAGANLGWSVYEGNSRFKYGGARKPVWPVWTYRHTRSRCSVTGGYVVRDRELPSLYGRYLFGDFCDGRVRSIRLQRPRARDVRAVDLRVPALSSFGEDTRGRIYATSLAGGVYRLAAKR